MKFVAQLSELKVAETYIKAIEIIIPQKATPNYHNIPVNFAKFYEQGGVMISICPSLWSAMWVLFQCWHLFQGGAKLACAHDLFEQALEKCPQKFYECATKVVADADKFEVCYLCENL